MSSAKKVATDLKKPSLEDWNWLTLMTLQASLGLVSSNVRAIVIKYIKSCWLINVYIAENSPSDKNNSLDIAEDTSVFLEDIKDKLSESAYVQVKSKVIVNNKFLDISRWLKDDSSRLIFLRNESESRS